MKSFPAVAFVALLTLLGVALCNGTERAVSASADGRQVELRKDKQQRASSGRVHAAQSLAAAARVLHQIAGETGGEGGGR